jgi:uncharacterized membrane protein YbhN (UPF0104 family)
VEVHLGLSTEKLVCVDVSLTEFTTLVIINGSTSALSGLGTFSGVLIFYIVGKTPWAQESVSRKV